MGLRTVFITACLSALLSTSAFAETAGKSDLAAFSEMALRRMFTHADRDYVQTLNRTQDLFLAPQNHRHFVRAMSQSLIPMLTVNDLSVTPIEIVVQDIEMTPEGTIALWDVSGEISFAYTGEDTSGEERMTFTLGVDENVSGFAITKVIITPF